MQVGIYPEKWRDYNREYQRRRRQEPEYRAKHNETSRRSAQKKKVEQEALIAAQTQEIKSLKVEAAELRKEKGVY